MSWSSLNLPYKSPENDYPLWLMSKVSLLICFISRAKLVCWVCFSICSKCINFKYLKHLIYPLTFLLSSFSHARLLNFFSCTIAWPTRTVNLDLVQLVCFGIGEFYVIVIPQAPNLLALVTKIDLFVIGTMIFLAFTYFKLVDKATLSE